MAVSTALAVDLTLTPANVGFHTPIGIDWQETTSKLILSSNYPFGVGNNLDQADPVTGSFSVFAPSLSGLQQELKIATVRASPCQAKTGFVVGEVFTGNGNPGEVIRVSADGSSVANPWTMLPGETALLRGSLFHDRFGVAGCDLVVVTSNEQIDNIGNVWRIASNGAPTFLASIGTHLEGVTTLPDDPLRFGPAAGRIIAGAERPWAAEGGYLVVVNPWAVNDFFTIGGPGTAGIGGHQHYVTNTRLNPEDLDLIRAKADLFAIAFADGIIYTAGAADFADHCGKLLITTEYPEGTSGFQTLGWDGSKFVVNQLTANITVAQWEHVTFSGGSDCATSASRMTGGGSVFASDGSRVTHGFELRCDAADARQNLEINWGSGKGAHNFHLDSITRVQCIDDPAIGPHPPSAGFDTYIGEGAGTCNGKPATIKFTFSDAGEPGKYDSAEYHIAGACTLDVAKSLLNKGNHQAHKG
jgi:hypothetical protein